MKKFTAILASLCAAAMLLSACGAPAASASASQTTPGASSAAPAQSGTATGTDVLTVYSPQADADRGGWIKEEAEKALGFTVEFLCASGGDLQSRLLAEKGNPQADVILGLVQPAMYQLKKEGLLTAYAPKWAEGLPEVYKDKDGFFHSFWQTPIVMAYNPEFMKNPPAQWIDLVKPEYKNTFAIPNATSQTIRTYIMGILWNYYDATTGDISQEGWDMVSKLFANAYELPAADADQWALMKEGELPISLNWFGGVKMNAAKNEIDIQYVVPEAGTPVVAEAVGIVTGTDQEDMAKAFIDWWGSAETMGAYANKFGQAPAHPDAIALCNDEVKADAQMFTAQEMDWEVCAEKMDEWFQKIELEIMP